MRAILGPNISDDSSQNGGAVLLFNNFLYELDKENVKYLYFDTNKKNYRNLLFFIFSFICYLINSSIRRPVSYELHSSNDYLFIIPIITIISRLNKSTLVLRKFGAEFENTLLGYNGWLKKVMSRLSLKCVNIIFVETKFLKRFLDDLHDNVNIFPNVRVRYKNAALKKVYDGKLIFIGRIEKEKGVHDIIAIAKDPALNVHIDFYGPVHDNKLLELIKLHPKSLTYKGIIDKAEIYKTIASYSALVLPSYKEGYPGVIIESFMCYRPVISTEVGGIPEIVQEGVGGVLFPPGDLQGFRAAITKLELHYEALAESTPNLSKKYDSSLHTKNYLNITSCDNSIT
ncbi:glycosyltransferase family 4 protein [Cobetia sp. 1CM21F]|uniref:glycosyltransferase family 4 protein n=1 Tax=Cobetia sp. 1CM21F TaxID=2929163 RepID=UPI0020BFAAF6|nr:glycosyltransferase family 4 protein [Cobetia sp. 1CM21F]MCK8066924.1 glycosyltransferase family 4 protein [Cobetia sp. 1CM21F]